MIDLERFTQTIEVVVPIVDGYGIFNGRRIEADTRTRKNSRNAISNSDVNTASTNTRTGGGEGNSVRRADGWYRVSLGVGTKIIRQATLNERRNTILGVSHKSIFTVIFLGSEGIALNTDIFYKRGYTESVKTNFTDVPLFTVGKIVRWEDGRFYFFETIFPKNRRVIQDIKDRFETDRDLLGLRGVTPELRYYYLLANLQRQSYRAAEEIERLAISRAEKDKRIREFQSTFAGRLQTSIERAGGVLIKFSKYGEGWMVEWRLDDETIKSIIHDDLRIVSAGFCLSGDDQQHSLHSIINLARLFKRESYLNITRT